MGDVLKFPGALLTAEQFVALVLKHEPSLAVHRQRLLDGLSPVFAAEPFTAEITIPDGLNPLERDLLVREVELYARRCALAVLQPALLALINHILGRSNT